MNVQVFRTSASSYQNSSFINGEQKILEKIPGVRYIKSLKEMDPQIPFILITNSHTDMEDIPEMILENTVLIIHPNSGFDNIKRSFIEKSKIPFILGNPIRSHAVAEYILSAILSEITPIPNHTHWDESRNWNRKLLRDQTVLLLGHGHIGKILKQSLSPLTREVRCYDPQDKAEGVESNWSTDLAKDINILIVAANADENNENFVDAELLSKLASDCIIINAARGSFINEVALESFLQKNKSAKCYLDVFKSEPFPPGYMNGLPNLNKTSHIAGVFQKLNHDIISFEFLVIDDFVKVIGSDQQEFLDSYKECLLTENHFSYS